MSNGDLSNQYIDDTFDGLLHVNGDPIPATGLANVSDGVGNQSSLSIGRSGNGIGVSGNISAKSLNVSEYVSTGFLKAGNVNYPVSPINVSLLNLVYPVGAVYFSANNVSPEVLFGGTWNRIADGRFIVGAGNGLDRNGLYQNFPIGETSGEYRHTLTKSQIPPHSHTGLGYTIAGNEGSNIDERPLKNMAGLTSLRHSDSSHTSEFVSFNESGTLDNELFIDETGGGESHNITPPGFGLYVYTRTA